MPNTHGSNVHTLRTPPTARFTPPPLVESQFDTYSSPDQQREHIDTPKTKTLFPVSIRCAVDRLTSHRWILHWVAILATMAYLAWSWSTFDGATKKVLILLLLFLVIDLTVLLSVLWVDRGNLKRSKKPATIPPATDRQTLLPDQKAEHMPRATQTSSPQKTKTLFSVSIQCATEWLASHWLNTLLGVLLILLTLFYPTLDRIENPLTIRDLTFLLPLLWIALTLFLSILWANPGSPKPETISCSTELQHPPLATPGPSKHDQLSTLYEQANWFATRPWRQLVTHPDVAALLEDRAVHLALLIEDLRTETTSPTTLEKNG